MELENKIRIYALENAIKFKGRANPGALVGKIMQEFPEWRAKAKELSGIIMPIVNEVNNLSLEEQENQFKDSGYTPEKKEVKKGGLKDFKNVPKEGVVMRFAPSPSGPMHIGHAIGGGVTSLYIKKYGGKYILRIEDTNSDNIYPPAYDQLPKDGEWAFGNVSEVWIQSDRMEIYYSYMKKLLTDGNGYICTCDPEDFKKASMAKEECPCRSLSSEENLERYNKMHNGEFNQGDAVLRVKSDMTHKNPAMRDFPLARINDSEHPRQGKKYRVWPLMNLSVTVDDIEAGMTHIIRGKDHMDNARRQEVLYKAFGKEDSIPETYFYGRINFTDLQVSCSKTKAKIAEGEFEGWDDIRIPFLGALKRRGYQPAALLKFVEELGLSQADKSVSGDEFFKTINSFNKDILEPKANRYFFVKDPVETKIKNAPSKELELDLHPELRKGGRKMVTRDSFYLAKEDLDRIEEDELFRLMDCINATKKENAIEFTKGTYEDFKANGKKIIHWLPKSEDLIDVELLMPDATKVTGLGEHSLSELKEGDVIQFERVGFVKLDKIEPGKLTFWFAHK